MARVLISMPESFLGKIDEVAENESRSRSLKCVQEVQKLLISPFW